MKVLLIAAGTRGDIEPFLAIGETLKAHHHVICCFPEQFRSLAEDSDIPFMGLTPKFLELLESEEGRMAMEGKGNLFRKIRAYFVLFKKSGSVYRLMSQEQAELIKKEKPDKIIFHIKANYPLIYEALHPGKTLLVTPIPFMFHPVEEHPHLGLPNLGRSLNRFTYKIGNYGVIKNVQRTGKGLYDTSLAPTKKLLSTLASTPTAFAISRFLFEPSNTWPSHVRVIGYHERNRHKKWTPSPSLLDFLSENNTIVFVTFGSMVNASPVERTATVMQVIEKLNLKAIINTGSGGLVEPANYDKERFHFLSSIPYEWILPKVRYMVHHGGAGTTHLALKYNCPAVIIPHIIDQFLWNQLNYEKGLGPKGVAINRLNPKNFERLLQDLVTTPTFKTHVAMASKILQEESDQKTLEYLVDF